MDDYSLEELSEVCHDYTEQLTKEVSLLIKETNVYNDLLEETQNLDFSLPIPDGVVERLGELTTSIENRKELIHDLENTLEEASFLLDELSV